VIASEPDSTVLQHVDLESEPVTQELHFRYKRNSNGRHAILSEEDRSVSIDARLRVSFDTYFNNFYESYWRGCTSVSDVTLRLRLAGRGVVSVRRQTGEGSVHAVGVVRFDSASPTTIEVPVQGSDGFAFSPGRVWFEIEGTQACTLFGGEWVTTDRPLRDVRPSVVFCTFNRVEYLSRIVRALAERKEVYEAISRIFVINQGERFALSDLVTSASEDFLDRLELIEQDNLGGCGGFSRGIYETLNDGSLTHFILLDDDIRLHAESIFRATRFMAYAHDDVVLGGHMLDLVRPNELYEAGADFHPANLLPRPIGQHTDLTERDALELFLRVRPADYNGWWFFMAPKSLAETLGLPVPCFIRGDDMEYGARLARNGVKTIPMPGVAVWHEPFYLKLGNWHYYFEVRNRLMMLSLHHNGDLAAVRRQIRRTFHRDAMLSRYNSCQYAIDAIGDYLAGGDRVFDTTNASLQRCLEHQKRIGARRVDAAASPNTRRFGKYRRKATLWAIPILRLARLILPVSMRRPKVLHTGRDQLVSWRPAVFHGYRLVEDYDGSLWELTRDPKLERRQLIEFERLMRKLRLKFDEDVVDRSAGTPWLGWWRRQFGEPVRAGGDHPRSA
jgi:galactofuranosylgalactofuranosylrhamnosyl-N-acetylglucosaminyl-diphospho-decaprenol beta-1,5/1,6-galactofuranosyltransferase